MTSKFETLEGELWYVFTKQPRLAYKATSNEPDRFEYTTALKPTQESLMKIMDLQAMGIKNKLSKGEDGKYMMNFKRPVEVVNKKTGAVTKRFEAPKVYQEDGRTEINDLIGNGSKGFVKVEVYEHGVGGGKKSHAARLDSILVTDLIKYGD